MCLLFLAGPITHQGGMGMCRSPGLKIVKCNNQNSCQVPIIPLLAKFAALLTKIGIRLGILVNIVGNRSQLLSL